MMVVDIETSGLAFEKNGIWQIGAIDFYHPENTFFGESRIDDEDEVAEEALKITGKTEEELRDKTKQSQKELLKKFFEWAGRVRIKNMVAHNFLDYAFLSSKARKYGLDIPLNYKVFDMHSIAQAFYFKEKGEFLFKGDKSDMGLPNIMKICGMKDERMHLDSEGNVVQKGKPHNALEDAKIENECLKKLLEGDFEIK